MSYWWETWGVPVVWSILFIGCVVFGVNSCTHSGWYQKSMAESIQQDATDAQPRVIREVDGCKVYTFKSGDRWHYFTRCPNAQTTTESPYSVRVGKTTQTKIETITTN